MGLFIAVLFAVIAVGYVFSRALAELDKDMDGY